MEIMLRRFSDLLIEPHGSIEKKNMVWNVSGSFVYAFASILLSFAVMRIAGDEIGGTFCFWLQHLWPADVYGFLLWDPAFSDY